MIGGFAEITAKPHACIYIWKMLIFIFYRTLKFFPNFNTITTAIILLQLRSRKVSKPGNTYTPSKLLFIADIVYWQINANFQIWSSQDAPYKCYKLYLLLTLTAVEVFCLYLLTVISTKQDNFHSTLLLSCFVLITV